MKPHSFNKIIAVVNRHWRIALFFALTIRTDSPYSNSSWSPTLIDQRELHHTVVIEHREVTKIGSTLRYRRYWDKWGRLVIAGDSFATQLWDTFTGRRVAVLHVQRNPIEWAEVDQSGNYLFTADSLSIRGANGDCSIYCWDLSTGHIVEVLPVELSTPLLSSCNEWAGYSLNAQTLLLNLGFRFNRSEPRQWSIIAKYDIVSRRIIEQSEVIQQADNIVFSPDRRYFVCSRQYGIGRSDRGGISVGGIGVSYQTVLVNASRLPDSCILDGYPNNAGRLPAIIYSKWSPDSSIVATVGNDHSVRLWNAVGKPIAQLIGHTNWITDVVFSPDSKCILTISEDCTAVVWSTIDGSIISQMIGHNKGVTDAVFSCDSRYVVTGSLDCSMRMWETCSGRCVVVFPEHQTAVVRVVCALDCDRLFSYTATHMMYEWSLKTKMCLSVTQLINSNDPDQCGNCKIKYIYDSYHVVVYLPAQ